MIAPANALTAMPVSTSVTMSVRPDRREDVYTSAIAAIPPNSAAAERPNVPSTAAPDTM